MKSRDPSSRDSGPLARPAFLFAAGFLVLVVLAAITVIATRGGGSHQPGVAKARRQSPSATQTAPSGCNVADTDQTIPQSPPTGVTWNLFHTVALPSSTADGPGVVDGDIASCYAHTPVGALIATQQIGVRMILSSNWRVVIDQQTVNGPGRAAAIQALAAATETDAAGSYGQIAGFRFVTYTPSVAVVDIVSRFSDGTMQITTETVQWIAGDWRLQLQPDGGEGPPPQAVSSLVGYIPWGGV